MGGLNWPYRHGPYCQSLCPLLDFRWYGNGITKILRTGCWPPQPASNKWNFGILTHASKSTKDFHSVILSTFSISRPAPDWLYRLPIRSIPEKKPLQDEPRCRGFGSCIFNRGIEASKIAL